MGLTEVLTAVDLMQNGGMFAATARLDVEHGPGEGVHRFKSTSEFNSNNQLENGKFN
jgi:hypothetical protein